MPPAIPMFSSLSHRATCRIITSQSYYHTLKVNEGKSFDAIDVPVRSCMRYLDEGPTITKPISFIFDCHPGTLFHPA